MSKIACRSKRQGIFLNRDYDTCHRIAATKILNETPQAFARDSYVDILNV